MALNLLAVYSSSEEEDEDLRKEPSPLPLPDSIANWKGVEHHREVVDDPDKHQGRLRSFKHERDQPSEQMQNWMSSLRDRLPVKCELPTDELHVSLSRTLILKFHWIKAFTEDLKNLCHRTDRFSLELSSLRAYSNDERTRTFLGLECNNPDGNLHSFMSKLNGLLTEYGLPPFYQDLSYHVSFLWCTGDQQEQLAKAALSSGRDLAQFLMDHAEDRYVHVDRLNFKTGNQFYAFKLK